MPRRRRPPRPGALAELSPRRILTQILLLQVVYYITAALLIVFTALVAGRQLSSDLVFSWQTLRGDNTEGWMLGLVWMLNALISVIFLLLFIARSKLVPDFALTIHFIHFVIVSWYSHSLPKNVFWWALQLASASLMTLLGIWSCQWRELKPIPFGGHAKGEEEAAAAAGAPEPTANERDGLAKSFKFGWSIGRAGRAKDGAGNYELLPTGQARNG